jgi:hypothetical protein
MIREQLTFPVVNSSSPEHLAASAAALSEDKPAHLQVRVALNPAAITPVEHEAGQLGYSLDDNTLQPRPEWLTRGANIPDYPKTVFQYLGAEALEELTGNPAGNRGLTVAVHASRIAMQHIAVPPRHSQWYKLNFSPDDTDIVSYPKAPNQLWYIDGVSTINDAPYTVTASLKPGQGGGIVKLRQPADEKENSLGEKNGGGIIYTRMLRRWVL